MRNGLWVLASVVVLAALTAFTWLAYVAARGGESAPLYSVRRYDPYGTAAIYQLLREMGREVHRLERPTIRPDERGVLIQVLPMETTGVFEEVFDQGAEALDLNADRLSRWIAEGNTVIQFTRTKTTLMQRLSVPVVGGWDADDRIDLSEIEDIESEDYYDFQVDDEYDAAPNTNGFESVAETLQDHQQRGRPPEDQPGGVWPVQWIDETAPAELASLRVDLRHPLAFAEDGGSQWQPWAKAAEQVAIGAIEHGDGRLIVIGAPSPILNGQLGEAGHLDLVLALIGDRPVYIDEWSHGMGKVGSVSGLIREFNLLPALIQIAVIILVFHWSTRGRKRVDRVPVVRRRSSLEQINVLGRLYRRSLSADELAKRVQTEVHRRAARVLRCAVPQIAERLKASPTDETEPVRSLLDRANQLSSLARLHPNRKRLDHESVLLLNQAYRLERDAKRD